MQIPKLRPITVIIIVAWLFAIVGTITWPDTEVYQKLIMSGLLTIAAVTLQIVADIFDKKAN